MSKNYYIILGIPSDSTQTDIKAAYRRLAKEFHPDHYGESQIPFQALQEAYSVLSDPKSRKAYDDSLQKTGRQSQQAEPTRRDFRPYSNRITCVCGHASGWPSRAFRLFLLPRVSFAET